MKCEEYLDLVLHRSPGQEALAQGDPEALSNHLLECRSCLEESPGISKFHTLSDLETPSNFLDLVLGALDSIKTEPEALSCEVVECELSAFLDGELAADKQDPIILHLANCDECTAVLTELKGLTGILGREFTKPLPIPANFANMVAEQAFSSAPTQSTPHINAIKPSVKPVHRPWGAWLSAAAAVAITSLMAFQFMGEPNINSKVTATVAKKGLDADKAPKPNLKTAPEKGPNTNGGMPAGPKPTATPKLDVTPDLVRTEFKGRKGGSWKSLEKEAAQEKVLSLSCEDLDIARGDLTRVLTRVQKLEGSSTLTKLDEDSWDLSVTTKQWSALVFELGRSSKLSVERRSNIVMGQSSVSKKPMPVSDPDDHRTFDPAKDLEDKAKAAKAGGGAGGGGGEAIPGAKPENDPEAKMDKKKRSRIDKVVLHSGWSLDGRIIDETNETVTLESAGREVNVPRREIRQVTRGYRDTGIDDRIRVRIVLRRGKSD